MDTVARLSTLAAALALAFLPVAGRGAAPAAPAETRNIVFLGDSITAGFGLEAPERDAYPGLIQKKIGDAGLAYRVVNAGVSGDTTAAGLRRVDWILQQAPAVFVIALGGNDGLRGVPPATTAANLQAIIDRVKARYPSTKIVLAGMMMPESLGAEFAAAYRELYPALAKKNSVTLVPFLLEGVGGIRDLNQGDGIHPTSRGQVIVAENVWKALRPLL